ncbi:MAG: zinc-ribbon domain-containing protein [Lachnospiraceae bacterium]|nr:zinc-ribbon domain-containing protein [Lachnospiraceae bacterium]
MFCNKCGNQVKEGFKFCSKCGAPVVQPIMPNVAPVQQPVNEAPVQQPVNEAPVQQPVYEAPVQQPVNEVPVQQPVYEAPVQQPVNEAPVQQPVYEAPVQQPVYEAPVQQPVYEAPVQQPIYETPVQQQQYVEQTQYDEYEEYEEEDEKSHKGVVIALVSLIVVLILAVGALLFIYFDLGDMFTSSSSSSSSSSSESSIVESSEDSPETSESSLDTASSSTPEETPEPTEVPVATEAPEETPAPEEPNGVLRTYASNTVDYSNPQVLDIEKYDHYDTGYDKFYFGYPADIFNAEYISTDVSSGHYGDVIEDIHLSGDDGIFLQYTLSRRTDGYSVIDMTSEVYKYERSFMYEPVDIMRSPKRDRGIVIVSGYTGSDESCLFYNLTYIDVDYVYQMKVYYPAETDNTDKRHKDYMVESLYRLCGFSGYKGQ